MSGRKQPRTDGPRALRVLLFHEDEESIAEFLSDLLKEGFEVRPARSFIDAAPLLVGNHVDVLLIYLPQIEWMQRAVFHEIRRVNAKLPIVAVAPTLSSSLTEQLRRMDVIHALATSVDRPVLLEALREAAGAESRAE